MKPGRRPAVQIGNGNTMHVHIHRGKTSKEKLMSTKQTITRTCDGCGATQTWVDDQKSEIPQALWYVVQVEFGKVRILGQRRFDEEARIDACSAACVSKALAKLPVPGISAEANETARPS